MVLTLCFAISASGCGSATKTVSSIEVPSPDGQWVAIGKTDQTSGPGSADLSTGIYLKRAGRSDPAVNVLTFENEPALSKQSITFQVIWISASHLEVLFNRMPTFASQTIKYSGIDISVQDLSSQAIKN